MLHRHKPAPSAPKQGHGLRHRRAIANPEATTGRKRSAAVRAADRSADGDPRHHRGEHRAAEPRRGSAAHRLGHQLDDHELLAHLRQPAPLRRPRRRPARPAPDVPDRPRHLHRLLVRLSNGRHRRRSLRRTRRPGPRRRDALPAALAIIMSAFQGNQRAKALAAWGAVGGAGAAIGVLVGGVLTEFTDWRMIFYVNLRSQPHSRSPH